MSTSRAIDYLDRAHAFDALHLQPTSTADDDHRQIDRYLALAAARGNELARRIGFMRRRRELIRMRHMALKRKGVCHGNA